MRLRILLIALALASLVATTLSMPQHRQTTRLAAAAELATTTTTTAPAVVPDVAAQEQAAAQWYTVAAQDQAAAQWYAEAARQQEQIAAAKAAARRHPAPPSDSTPAPAVGGGTGDAAAAIHEFFDDIFDQAWGVTQCESGHDPGEISPGGGNWGLFQLNTVHRDDFERYTGQPWSTGALNAHYNAMYARKLYDAEGWGPWACKWAA